ncbi:MAG TPA: hypothetical protein VJ909_01065 [Prolixibacteraceae bacterium]|nr:hypothetical protein [Prolixibacteraceae bacterium]
MKKIDLGQRKNILFRFFASLALSTLLLYPVVFSFSHVLNHHLESHNHHHASVNSHCCDESGKGQSQATQDSFSKIPEHCPVLEYDFAAAVENAVLVDGGIILSRTTLHFRYANRKFSVRLNRDNAPRAPPAS